MVVRGGASAAQDGRFSKKQQKELAKLKAPPEYALKVNFGKVVLPPINAWVVKRVQELLKGLDDEVLVGTIIESLKQGTTAKELHYELTPFLCNNTTLFVKELWALLHSASESASGIPATFEAQERERLERRRADLAAHQAKFEEARARQRVPDSPERRPPPPPARQEDRRDRRSPGRHPPRADEQHGAGSSDRRRPHERGERAADGRHSSRHHEGAGPSQSQRSGDVERRSRDARRHADGERAGAKRSDGHSERGGSPARHSRDAHRASRHERSDGEARNGRYRHADGRDKSAAGREERSERSERGARAAPEAAGGMGCDGFPERGEAADVLQSLKIRESLSSPGRGHHEAGGRRDDGRRYDEVRKASPDADATVRKGSRRRRDAGDDERGGEDEAATRSSKRRAEKPTMGKRMQEKHHKKHKKHKHRERERSSERHGSGALSPQAKSADELAALRAEARRAKARSRSQEAPGVDAVVEVDSD